MPIVSSDRAISPLHVCIPACLRGASGREELVKFSRKTEPFVAVASQWRQDEGCVKARNERVAQTLARFIPLHAHGTLADVHTKTRPHEGGARQCVRIRARCGGTRSRKRAQLGRRRGRVSIWDSLRCGAACRLGQRALRDSLRCWTAHVAGQPVVRVRSRTRPAVGSAVLRGGALICTRPRCAAVCRRHGRYAHSETEVRTQTRRQRRGVRIHVRMARVTNACTSHACCFRACARALGVARPGLPPADHCNVLQYLDVIRWM